MGTEILTRQLSLFIFLSQREVPNMEKGGSRFFVLNNQKSEKQKNFWVREMGNPTGEEIGVPDQDFSTVPDASVLITHKSSESRIVDLTKNGMVNHYLRDVDHVSHCLSSQDHIFHIHVRVVI